MTTDVVSRPIQRRASRPAPLLGTWDLAAWAAVALCVFAFATTFSWLSIERHLAYQSHAFDLGNMDQAVWNTLHGSPLRFTDMQAGHIVLTNRLAIHVEPLLVAMALPYALCAGPMTLLVVQACVVALGAVPIFLIARDALRSSLVALVFPLAYVLHPSLQNAALDDFHAVTMSACFLGWALLYALRGQKVPFVAFALLSASTKEEVSLVVALMGLTFVRRSPRFALTVAAAGVAWFALCVAVIIPHFNPGHHSPYLSRYAYLGHGLGGVLLGIARHPHIVWDVVTSPGRLAYLAALLRPLGWTSILGLPTLLLGLPVFAINMLSTDATMYSGQYQYSAELVPIVVGASAVGTGYAASLLPSWSGRTRLRGVLWVLVVVASAVATTRSGFTPLARGYAIPGAGRHQALENAALDPIPRTDVLAASDEMEPHVSQRRWVYLLPTVHPDNGPAAKWIVLDASIPGTPVTPAVLHHSFVDALHAGYGIVSATDGVVVLRQGAPRAPLPAAFYSFMYGAPPAGWAVSARWGTLRLVGVTVHPRSSHIDSARPAISVETWWRVTGAVPSHVRVYVAASPVYRGGPPAFSAAWEKVHDNPASDWVPLRLWPRGRTIHAAFVSLLPSTVSWGRVNVALGVEGVGPATGLHGATLAKGSQSAIQIARVTVGY